MSVVEDSVEISVLQPRCAEGFQMMVTQESFCHEDCLTPNDDKEAPILEDNQTIQLNTGKSTYHLLQ